MTGRKVHPPIFHRHSLSLTSSVQDNAGLVSINVMQPGRASSAPLLGISSTGLSFGALMVPSFTWNNSGLVIPGTVIALQNRPALFSLNPDHPTPLYPTNVCSTPSFRRWPSRVTSFSSAIGSWVVPCRPRDTRRSSPTWSTLTWGRSRKSTLCGSALI